MNKITITIICLLLVTIVAAAEVDNYCEQGDKVIVCYMNGRVLDSVNNIINKVTQQKDEALVLNAELSIIDEEFLLEFNDYVQNADELELQKVKSQLNDYVSTLKEDISVGDEDIQDLLDEKIDFEEFIKRAWSDKHGKN